MKSNEIEKLARLYAEQNPPQCEDEVLRQNGIYLNATMVFEPFLKWLSKTHCIVEKDKVDALQSEIFKEVMDAHDNEDWQGVAHYILDVMPRSFYEIFGNLNVIEDSISQRKQGTTSRGIYNSFNPNSLK